MKRPEISVLFFGEDPYCREQAAITFVKRVGHLGGTKRKAKGNLKKKVESA